MIIAIIATASITSNVGIVVAFITALAALLSVRVNKRTAHAAETTAEGNAIKAIAEANEIAVRNLRTEVDRLSQVVNKLNDRLNQERQWVIRLIRALNQAGVEIPARPTATPGSDLTDTDETISMALTMQESRKPAPPAG